MHHASLNASCRTRLAYFGYKNTKYTLSFTSHHESSTILLMIPTTAHPFLSLPRHVWEGRIGGEGASCEISHALHDVTHIVYIMSAIYRRAGVREERFNHCATSCGRHLKDSGRRGWGGAPCITKCLMSNTLGIVWWKEYKIYTIIHSTPSQQVPHS